MITDNPFVSNANQINTEHFIGREKEIRDKIKKFILGDQISNLSIIGIPDIGKTALIQNTVFRSKDELKKRGVHLIELNTSTFIDPLDFFQSLVKETEDQLKEDRSLQQITNSVTTEMTEENLRPNTTKFFTELENTNFRIIFVLDKFDHAELALQKDVYFNLLRDLASKSCLSFLVLSSRRITDIEKEITRLSFSPFGQLFEAPLTLRLKMFSDDDINIYFKKYEKIGMKISQKEKEKVLFYCGRHPYLLQVLGNKIVDIYNYGTTKQIDINAAADTISEDGVFLSYYRRLTVFLESVKLFSPLLQILFGDLTSVNSRAKTELERYGTELERYGLIQEDANGGYIAYSQHFQEYLNANREEFKDNYKSSEQNQTSEDSVNSVVPAESLDEFEKLRITWSETEEAFREIITTAMSRQFGDAWIEEAVEQYEIFQTIIEKCRERKQIQEETSSGNVELSESNLFGFTMTYELFDTILDNTLWNDFFKSIFGGNWNYWKERGDFIVPIGRRFIAHNNMGNFLDDQKLTFAGYCEEILRIHEEFKKSANTVQDEPAVVSPPGTVTGTPPSVSPPGTVTGTPPSVSPPGTVTGTPPSVPTGRQKGRINFISDRGFGRITPNTCGSDHVAGIYVHVSECSELMSLQEGQEVEFEIQDTYKGWNAKNVSLV